MFLFSMVTGSIKGVRCGEGEQQKIWLSSNGQTSPSVFVVANFISLVSPQAANLTHSVAPPLPKKSDDFSGYLFLPFVSLVPLQMAVVKLQHLYHKIRFLPSGYRYGMSLVIRSSRKAGFSFWLGFSSSMMLWITSSVSLPSCINFFILIA